jgi:Mor family transcriptional regulator
VSEISPKLHGTMNALARGLDDILNGSERPKKVAFVLLTANMGDYVGGRVNYISNGERADIVAMMKELIARFEGRRAEGTDAAH